MIGERERKRTVLKNRHFAVAALAATGATMAYSQVLIERGLATGAGAGAGVGAGRGIVGVFRGVDEAMNKAGTPPAASKDPKDKKVAEATKQMPASKPASAETMSKVRIAGAGTPAVSAPAVSPAPAFVPLPDRIRAAEAEQALPQAERAVAAEPVVASTPAAVAGPSAEPIAEPVAALPAEPPGPTVVAYDFEMLASGITRDELVAQVGKPQTRLSLTDSRGDAEVYRYRVEGAEVAVIKLKAGLVDSIELLDYWMPKPVTPAPQTNVIKVAGLQ